MAHPNVDLLRRSYEAFNTGDMDTLRASFTDDIMGHAPGKSPVAGDYKGVDEVFGFFQKLFELSGGTLKVEPHSILADDEHGTVLGFQSAEREGKRVGQFPTIEVYHFTGGKISEWWTFSPDQYAQDEFWS
jgi:ketosteroid isomerase-like protein